MTATKAGLALLLAGAALAGCGRQATLDRPGPFIGEPPTANAEQAQRLSSAANAKAAAAAVADPQAPLSVDEVRHQPLPRPPEFPSTPPDDRTAPPSSAPPS